MSQLRCWYCGRRVLPEDKSECSNHYKGHIFCDGICGNLMEQLVETKADLEVAKMPF